MDKKDFKELANCIFRECDQVLNVKGAEYCLTDDRFDNFKRQGESMDMFPDDILKVYLQKHFDSISTYLKTWKTYGILTADGKTSEPIVLRFVDSINYLLLRLGMIEEARLRAGLKPSQELLSTYPKCEDPDKKCS